MKKSQKSPRLQIGKIIEPEIHEMVAQRDFNALRSVFASWTPVELAEVIMDLPEHDEAVIFCILPRKLAAEAFEYLDFEAQERLLSALGEEEVANILNDMSPDDRTALLEELPPEVIKKVISLLSPEKRAVAQTLLGYPPGSVGRLMTPNYVSVPKDWTVKQVLDYVREHGEDKETLNMIYVVDADGSLLDDMRIRKLLLSPLDKTVSSLMKNTFVSLYAGDDQSHAVKVFKENDRVALPVTDSDGKLLGIVTIDDVLDVAEKEATEEIQRVGGSEALDEPYIQIAFSRMIQKRAGWLVVLFLGEMLTATAMGFFQDEIARVVILAMFVPLIISSGGNSGSQAATLVIRALALDEIRIGDWWRVMRREIAAGLCLGLILGTIGFIRIALWSTFTTIYGPHWILIGTAVSLSLVGVVLWGTLMGSMLPLLLRRCGVDPATSSAPFVATLVDVTGLVIYFSIAYLILHGTLL